MNKHDLVTIVGNIPIDERVARDLEGAVIGPPQFLNNGSVEFKIVYKDGGPGIVNVKGPSEATTQIRFATDSDWPMEWPIEWRFVGRGT